MSKKYPENSDTALRVLWKMVRSNELYTYEMFRDDLTTWFRKYSTGYSPEKEPYGFYDDTHNKDRLHPEPEMKKCRYCGQFTSEPEGSCMINKNAKKPNPETLEDCIKMWCIHEELYTINMCADKVRTWLLSKIPQEKTNDWMSCKDEMEWKQKHIDFGYNQALADIKRNMGV